MFVASFDGRLTSDAEMRYTPTGNAVINFTVMTDFYFPGENEPKSMPVRCSIWREAEKLVQNLTKGRQLFIIGDCRFSVYQGKGNIGINIDCNVHRVTLGALPKGA